MKNLTQTQYGAEKLNGSDETSFASVAINSREVRT